MPDDISGLTVGSIVRVPLGGRTVRGFVTSLRERQPDRALRPIAAKSGALPIFDERLLQTARWAAAHYVAPLAVVLGATAPPNLPRPITAAAVPPLPAVAPPRRTRPRYFVSGGDHGEAITALVTPVLASGRNAMVVVPTAAECEQLAAALESALGSRVVSATSSHGGSRQTKAWSTLASQSGLIAIGTRELALWPCGDLGMVVVVEEGRSAMKAKQTPTFHVRDLMRRRSNVERFDLAFFGPVPTLEAIAAGVDVVEPEGRVWPLVEVADRNEEPPGTGVVGEQARAAITAVAARGGRVFVLVPRRGYAGAFACVRCGTIRRCQSCGAGGGRGAGCERCGEALPRTCVCGADRFRPVGAGIGRVIDDLRRSVADFVGEFGSGRQVIVGTERDLVEINDQDLAVAVDLDGGILAPTYRAGEDALRLGARLALTLGAGRGRRCLVQTSLPAHPVIIALRAGRPMEFLSAELATRELALLPPVGELIALEVRGVDAEHADGVIRSAAVAASVRGPAIDGHVARWLIQGTDLSEARLRLRSTVQALRDGELTVRIDADPVDL